MNKYQKAFTLVELMIALALGLLVVAAAMSIYLASQKSVLLQSSLDELRQNANFGMKLLAHDVRHANLNTGSNLQINSMIVGSGIVLKPANFPSGLQSIANLGSEYISLGNKDLDSTGTAHSDRLVIQFRPSLSTFYNCEGQEVMDANTKTIVQRYYVKPVTRQIAGEPTSYALYCDAGSYTDGATTIDGLDNSAQQIMQQVDAFKVRLGVRYKNGTLGYLRVPEYSTKAREILTAASGCSQNPVPISCASELPNIISVELNVLVRSTGKIGANATTNAQLSYQIADRTITLAGDAEKNKQYLRQVISQVVALRNGVGTS